MSTYCISDIHGQFDKFMELLDVIAFSESDELYILGDIIDRGPKSAEMLVWAVDKAPSNIHFMCGNHEDMALDVVQHNPHWLQQSRSKTLWTHNGGRATAARLKKITDKDWRACELLPWLEKLPVFEKVNAGGRDYMLVHAGFATAFFDSEINNSLRKGLPKHLNVKAESDLLRLSHPVTPPPIYDVGYGFGKQGRDEMLWSYKEWFLDSTPTPMNVVHGHVAFSWRDIDRIALVSPQHAVYGVPGKICHYFGNRYCIDCSGAAACAPYRLGALRLDDLAEFYVTF